MASLAILIILCVLSLSSAAPLGGGRGKGRGPPVEVYLRKYGYMDMPEVKEIANLGNEMMMSTALRQFQRMAGLPMTGRMDTKTYEMMETPRCGNKDVSVHVSSNKRQKRWVYDSY